MLTVVSTPPARSQILYVLARGTAAQYSAFACKPCLWALCMVYASGDSLGRPLSHCSALKCLLHTFVWSAFIKCAGQCPWVCWYTTLVEPWVVPAAEWCHIVWQGARAHARHGASLVLLHAMYSQQGVASSVLSGRRALLFAARQVHGQFSTHITCDSAGLGALYFSFQINPS